MLVTRKRNPLVDLDQMFFDLPWFRNSNGANTYDASGWVPRTDIREDGNHYLISTELPEIEKKDISVGVEDHVLTIKGERQQSEEHKGVKYHLTERSYGSFSRRFRLPEDADLEQLEAEYKDGVLNIRVGKFVDDKVKKIDVQIQ